MLNNIEELYKVAGAGVEKLLKAGIPLSEIFSYDLSAERIKEFQKILSD